jgi:ferredoxin/coenzyme F420-reducing hydrogenase delta subunit
MGTLRKALRYGFGTLEGALDAITGSACNPLSQLGAIGWFLFWIVAGTGIYLYIFLDTGVVRAYQSIEAITHGQPWAGGVLRSVHRYASDALVIVAGVHLLREFSLDRMRGRRWFAWLTGLPLVMFIYICGLTGYWMVWDRLAQYIATMSARWLDALGIFGEPISHNFVDNASVSSRFFTLIVYLHIAAPLLMLLFMWIHIQRYNHARINPPRRLMVAIGLGLALLAVFQPAISQPPADLDHLATSVAIDWFYLPLFPLTDRLGAGNLWLLLVGGGLLLATLPWAPPARRRPAAQVHLDDCNGCARCFVDCPFTAITMRPRTDGAPFTEEASVDESLCVACGLCVGACPTATPFRRASALVPGIDLPEFPMARLRERLVAALGVRGGPLGAVVFRCEHGAACHAVDAAAVLVIDVPCLGVLPPPFLDFIIHERLAEGVLLAGCRHDDCYERLGIRWTEGRIAGLRDPGLRTRVPRERIGLSYAGQDQAGARRRALAGFLARRRPRGPTSAGHCACSGCSVGPLGRDRLSPAGSDAADRPVTGRAAGSRDDRGTGRRPTDSPAGRVRSRHHVEPLARRQTGRGLSHDQYGGAGVARAEHAARGPVPAPPMAGDHRGRSGRPAGICDDSCPGRSLGRRSLQRVPSVPGAGGPAAADAAAARYRSHHRQRFCGDSCGPAGPGAEPRGRLHRRRSIQLRMRRAGSA